MKNLKRATFGLSVLIALLCLHGCGGAEVKKNADGSTSIARGIAADIEVVELTLSDGTKCAALIGNRRGALTCNWK